LLDPLLAGKADSQNQRREEPQSFGKIGPFVSLFDCLFAGKADSRNERREEPLVSRRSAPSFHC